MRSDPNGDVHATFSGARSMPGQVVTGAPYSADQVFEHTQTLADGTHISQPNNGTQHVARDPQGRMRVERPIMGGDPAAQNMPTLIEISDPIAGVAYLLDEQNKVAHRVTIEVRARNAAAQGGGAGGGVGGGGGGVAVAVGSSGMTATPRVTHPNQPEVTNEKLGSQNIEGVVAEGTRRTMTWPIGSQGNDRPLVNTTETWLSKELQLAVLTKSTDLRYGDSVTKLINISRAEPDATLFQPPADYTVVDDKDSITLNLKRH